MPDDDRPIRASIGFEGGQVIALRVRAEPLARLREALAGGGWHDLEVEDGTVRVNVTRVVYVHTETDEHRVGF
jgi:acetyl-CoA carboxylase beta subunit